MSDAERRISMLEDRMESVEVQIRGLYEGRTYDISVLRQVANRLGYELVANKSTYLLKEPKE